MASNISTSNDIEQQQPAKWRDIVDTVYSDAEKKIAQRKNYDDNLALALGIPVKAKYQVYEKTVAVESYVYFFLYQLQIICISSSLFYLIELA